MEKRSYQMICDLRGNERMNSSYTSANQFRLDVRIGEFQYQNESELKQESYDEEIAQIAHKFLVTQLHRLAIKHLTEKQLRVFNGLLAGKTPTEMAREFGCTESNIRQAIHGNSRGQGGLIRKLRKLVKAKEKTTSSMTKD